MNKLDLREFLFKFTEEELFYKGNPTYKAPYYQKLEKIKMNKSDSIYIFSFDVEQENLREKGKLNTKHSYEDQFLIVQQSRFSNILPHKHDFIEMNLVYSGEATAIIQGKEVHLKKGSVCILDTDVTHTIMPLGEDDIFLNLLMRKKYFNSAMLSRLSNNDIISNFLLNVISNKQEHDRYIVFENTDPDLLINLTENLLCEYYSPSFCIKEIIDAYMVLIFAELLKNYQKNETKLYKSSNKTYVGEIIEYISEHFKTCTLKSVAQEFSLHPNYLSRYIKQNTGHSYKELLQQQRINKACFLLLNTDLPIEAIAEEVGYKNRDFFYQKFRKNHKMTPKEYRSSNKKG